MRVALGVICSPAPNSASSSARSNIATSNPALSSASADGEAADAGAGDQRARHGLRPSRELALARLGVGAERGVVDEAGRAIGADRFRIATHVDEDMGMVEGRCGPVHINSFTPTRIVATPGSLWKCGMA